MNPRAARDVGRDLLNHFKPLYTDRGLGCREACDVTAGPRQARDKALACRIGDLDEHDWYGAGHSLQSRHPARAIDHDDIRPQSYQFLRGGPKMVLIGAPAGVHADSAVLGPPQRFEPLSKRRGTSLSFGIALDGRYQHADTPHVRACGKWPSCCAANECDELAPPHSITSSAPASNAAGTVMPSAFAVLRLITRRKLVGC